MDFESEILRLAAKNDETIRQLFDDYFNELAAYGVRTPKKDGIFSFEKDLPPKEREAVKELTKDFQEKLYQQIHFGIDVAVGISLAKDVEFLRANFPEGLNIHQPRRKDAREAFVRQRTKPAGRLSLSDRVWNYTNQSRAEAEVAMSLAIEDGVVQGKTAAELGRELRKYLNDPDRMYRRYHKKIVDSTGAKRDVVVWKKRVIGADGKVHFVDADLEKTGQGVCRSARKNAERCSRSEINSAYRYSDYERWNDEEFVIGIKISLSNNHTIKKEIKRGNRHVKINVPFHDICDDLQGIYPKSFKWAGWHPQCRCHATAVTASKEEKMRWLAEGCPKGYFDNQQVKKAPANFVKYIAENKEKIASAKSLPFWVQDNLKLQKTPAGAEKVVNLLGIDMKKPVAYNIPSQKYKSADYMPITITAETKNAINSAKVTTNIVGDKVVSREDAKKILLSVAGQHSKNIDEISFESLSNGLACYDRELKRVVIAENTHYIGQVRYNSDERLRQFLAKITAGKKNWTFEQEYAVEIFNHELQHSKTLGWINKARAEERGLVYPLEAVNQFCSRMEYRKIMESLGVKPLFEKEILKNGYGVEYGVKNLLAIFDRYGIKYKTANKHLKKILYSLKGEDVAYGLSQYLERKGVKNASDIVLMLHKEPSEFIKLVLKGVPK